MTDRLIQPLVLTDDSIEVPAQLRDFTGSLHIRTPPIDMMATIVPPELSKTSRAVLYPPNGEAAGLPPGHIGLEGDLSHVLDVREEGYHGE